MTTGPRRIRSGHVSGNPPPNPGPDPGTENLLAKAEAEQQRRAGEAPYFPKLYSKNEAGEMFSIPFSSPQSFRRFAEQRAAGRAQMRAAGEDAAGRLPSRVEKRMSPHGDTASSFTLSEVPNPNAADLAHIDAAEKVKRTLAPEQTMPLYIDPEELHRNITHSTDLNGAPQTVQNWSQLQRHKLIEAKKPPMSGHGSGLYQDIEESGEIRDPVRVVVSSDRLMHHEGHHRSAVGRAQGKMVPIELHSRVFSSQVAERLQRIKNAETTSTPGPTPPPTPDEPPSWATGSALERWKARHER